jgi:hypothetical protein
VQSLIAIDEAFALSGTEIMLRRIEALEKEVAQLKERKLQSGTASAA